MKSFVLLLFLISFSSLAETKLTIEYQCTTDDSVIATFTQNQETHYEDRPRKVYLSQTNPIAAVGLAYTSTTLYFDLNQPNTPYIAMDGAGMELDFFKENSDGHFSEYTKIIPINELDEDHSYVIRRDDNRSSILMPERSYSGTNIVSCFFHILD